MATRYWVSTTGDATTTASWNTLPDGSGTAALPVNGDTVIFFKGSVSMTTPITGLTGLYGKILGGPSGYRGNIQTPSTPWNPTWASLEIYDPIGNIYLSGTSTTTKIIKLNRERGQPYPDGLTHLTGAQTALEVSGGSVRVGGNITTGRFSGGQIQVDAVTTFTNCYVTGHETRISAMKLPDLLEISGGGITLDVTAATSATPTIRVLGPSAYVDYRVNDVPTVVLRTGEFSMQKNVYDISSIPLEHWDGSRLDIRTNGTTLSFSETRVGRGSDIFRGTGTYTGVSSISSGVGVVE